MGKDSFNKKVNCMLKKSVTEISEDLKSLYTKTAKKLKGSDRRQFMAEVVIGLGVGGQTLGDSHKINDPIVWEKTVLTKR